MESLVMENLDSELAFKNSGFKKESYAVGFTNKDENNDFPIYYHRTPIFFRDCQNLSRGIYFSNFFAWMGKIRESALFPILKDISAELNTGEIGMVTNSTSLKILGEVLTGDVVETRFWASGLFENKSTFDLFYEWRKVLDDGSYERIAEGEMRVSWVKIVSHGQVKPLAVPAYLEAFIKEIQMPKGASYVSDVNHNPFNSLKKGKELYFAPPHPRRGKLIAEELIETTLEDANSVGNIYFSNYSRWQGVVRDKFFYKLNKNYFQGIGEAGELIATASSMNHLREVMPFDTILITMNVVEVWENGAELTFTYFKVDGNEKLKLATGAQTVMWVKKENKNSFKSYPWPKEFLEALLK